MKNWEVYVKERGPLLVENEFGEGLILISNILQHLP